MELITEERAQGSIETIGLVAVAIIIVVIVGFYLKSFITEDIKGEIDSQLTRQG